MKISVVVPAYNEEKYIARCVKSIQEQFVSDIEIIIVNDASTDKTKEIIEILAQRDKRIIIINKKQNQKQALAISDGCRLAKGEIILVIGSDGYMGAGYLQKVLTWFENKDTIAVGGILKPTNMRNPISRRSYLLDSFHTQEDISFTTDLAGSGMAVRRDVFFDIGGYDIKCTWGQDRDLNRKLRNYAKEHKSEIVFDPTIEIFTDFEETLQQIYSRRFNWGTGRVYVARRSKKLSLGDLYRLFFIPVTLIGAVLGTFNYTIFILTMGFIAAPMLITIHKTMKNTNLMDNLYFILISYIRLIATSAGMLSMFLRREEK